jgi:serine/threonine-protein kinase
VCRALAAVHAAGLLHRDIKAQNVMREDGGRVVLMDFGAGLPVTEDPARAASITGTPLYLAPEVLERGEASARSDVYSVGVLLYHLVTGDFPVRGRGPSEILEAHAHGQVKRLGDVAPALDSWLVRVVERATAHDPRDRYATAGELEAALARRRAPLSIWPIVTAAGLTLAVALGVQQLRNPGPAVGSGPTLAVLPLEAGIGVDPPLAVAITDEIYQGLAMVDSVSVIGSFSSAKAKRDHSTIPAIAKVLEASAVIDGMVSEVDGQFEVKLRVFDAGRDSPRWAGIVSAPKSSPGTLRRDGAMSIARALNIALSARALRRLTRPGSVSSQAYDAYARGRDLQSHGTRGDLERARDELETSIRLDPGYAPAYAALARVRLDLGANGRYSEWAAEGQLARLAATRALDLEPQLAEAHVALGQVAFLLDWNWAAAERAFQRALSIPSSDDGARQRYAQLLNARGRVDDALKELDTARRLDPLSESLDGVVASTLQYARRFAEAETLLVSARGRLPNPSMVHNQLGRIFAATGRFDRAIAEFEQLSDSPTGDAYVEAEIGAALAGAGRIADAQTILERLRARAATEEISPEVFSLIETRLGQIDSALANLELAVAQRARRVIWMKVDPRWDPLRGHPRFTALVSRLGL